MTGNQTRELEQLLHKARRAFGNGINHDLLREARIEKGWISQRAVVEEYYRLMAVCLREDQLQRRSSRRLDIKTWFAWFIGSRQRG
ncbi:hypothetical protein AYJ54_43470 [Bradyrhizobium centrolobii]|uniref:Uncharacterized protein n=1 Tax=Bradyrhizobium centrolobii TaxID=1505087 RepID=A0A176Z030_9BRAD|nr:hypothetical protein AYJ54_43470 [Bradyrhizobium centrolobii]